MNKRIWIIDVDGTLARRGDRDPYDLTCVGKDLPNEPVVELVHALMDQVGERRIFIVSGRQDCCRVDTEEWLTRYGIRYRALFMRATGDARKDSDVKFEMFLHRIKPVVLEDLMGEEQTDWAMIPLSSFRILDDRDQCVKMWRDLGVFCAQVGQGDF